MKRGPRRLLASTKEHRYEKKGERTHVDNRASDPDATRPGQVPQLTNRKKKYEIRGGLD